MKQVLIQKGTAVVENVPAPLIKLGHVLVEVSHSLISTGTELAGINQSRKSLLQKAIEQPEKIQKLVGYLRDQGINKTISKVQDTQNISSPTGYSCSGIVVQVGEGIKDIKVGDRVACAGAGIANHAELVLVPRNLVVIVPDNCGLQDAASVTLGSIAMQGVRRTDPRLGDIVAVIGLGLLGQITVQLLKAAGCRVIGLDLDPSRIELARKFGLERGYNPFEIEILNEVRHITGDHGVDATIITAASESDTIVQQAMEITRKKGRVVVVGAVNLEMARSPFYEKEIDFLISCSYGPGRYDEQYERKGLDYPYAYVRWTENRNMQEYLRLIAASQVDIRSIVNRVFDIAKASEAYELLKSSEDKPLGVLLSYPLDEKSSGRKFDKRVILKPHKSTDKINVALVGAGGFAKDTHLPNLQKLADLYHLRAIVSSTGSNSKISAQQCDADYATTDFDEVLQDKSVDMVLICTRHNLHAPMAIKAAQAGKAIFLEKPMALNHAELDELETVLKETQVPFIVGFNRRFSPAAQKARTILSSLNCPMMLLYRVNAGYLAQTHWTQTEEGGGRTIGEASHMFDLFQFLVSPAQAVEVSSTSIGSQAGHLSNTDNVVTTVRYDDGSVATLLYTALGTKSFSKEYVEIYADGKVLVIDDFHSLEIHGMRVQGWESRIQNKGHLEELREFAEHILGRKPALIALESLVETTKISLLVEEDNVVEIS